jgi:predicted RNase H-like HicB family nuclease
MKKNDIIKELKIKGYTVTIYREPEPEENGYKMYADVKELSGCFIAGDSEKEIIAEAPSVIEMFSEARKEIAKKKPKLISVKVKPELYDFLVKYANDNGVENVSTAVRSLAVTKLREEGYSVPSGYAVSRPSA